MQNPVTKKKNTHVKTIFLRTRIFALAMMTASNDAKATSKQAINIDMQTAKMLNLRSTPYTWISLAKSAKRYLDTLAATIPKSKLNTKLENNALLHQCTHMKTNRAKDAVHETSTSKATKVRSSPTKNPMTCEKTCKYSN